MRMYVHAGENEYELVPAYLLDDRHALFLRNGIVWITRFVGKDGVMFEDPECGGLVIGYSDSNDVLPEAAAKLRKMTGLDMIAVLLDKRMDVDFDILP